jgi:two-component system LytT family response regulator
MEVTDMKVYSCGLEKVEEDYLFDLLKSHDYDYRYFSENKMLNIDETYDMYFINSEKSLIDIYKYYNSHEDLLEKTVFISDKITEELTFCQLYSMKLHKKEIVEAVKNIIERNENSKSSEIEIGKLVVKGKGRIHFINPDEILFVEKVQKQIMIHKKDEKIKSRDTLSEIGHKLPKNFLNLHKSYIVNINEIDSISEVGDRTYEVNFKETESKALMSRYKAEVLFSMFDT